MKQLWCLFATQLQGLAGELREGLHAALTELSELRQRDNGLEDKLQTHLTEVDDKIMGLKNSLNTLKVVDHTAISFNGLEAVSRHTQTLMLIFFCVRPRGPSV